jgi:hypothetical protein
MGAGGAMVVEAIEQLGRPDVLYGNSELDLTRVPLGPVEMSALYELGLISRVSRANLRHPDYLERFAGGRLEHVETFVSRTTPAPPDTVRSVCVLGTDCDDLSAFLAGVRTVEFNACQGMRVLPKIQDPGKVFDEVAVRAMPDLLRVGPVASRRFVASFCGKLVELEGFRPGGRELALAHLRMLSSLPKSVENFSDSVSISGCGSLEDIPRLSCVTLYLSRMHSLKRIPDGVLRETTVSDCPV